jgi:hypothetical protein
MTAIPLGTALTSTTPATALAAVASNPRKLAPNVGGLAMTAVNMPGRMTSMPNVALPVTLIGLSSRRCGLPIYLKVDGSLSVTVVGSGSGS